jgi:hypothetical protein
MLEILIVQPFIREKKRFSEKKKRKKEKKAPKFHTLL